MKIVRVFAFLVASLLVLAGSPHLTAAQGNSEAAHACQQGGYAWLVGTDGETFTNPGQCTSYAAHGGEFQTGVIVVPAGASVTISGRFSACNALQFGYVANGTAVPVDSKAAGCASQSVSATVGPFATTTVLDISLYDVTCDASYSAYGNHARIGWGDAPTSFQIDIADAGPGCSVEGSVVTPATGAGNLSVTLTIG